MSSSDDSSRPGSPPLRAPNKTVLPTKEEWETLLKGAKLQTFKVFPPSPLSSYPGSPPTKNEKLSPHKRKEFMIYFPLYLFSLPSPS